MKNARRMYIQAVAERTKRLKAAEAALAANNQAEYKSELAAAQAMNANIEQLQAQLAECVNALEQIKQANRPSPKARTQMYDVDAEQTQANAVADEIAQNLEALIGTTEDTEPKAAPKHAVADTNTKFADLKFGRNYDPNQK